MFQFGLIRLAMNFVFGVLSNLRTVIWIGSMVAVIGYGYLVFQNDFNFIAAFSDITGYVENAWSMGKGTYSEWREGLAAYR